MVHFAGGIFTTLILLILFSFDLFFFHLVKKYYSLLLPDWIPECQPRSAAPSRPHWLGQLHLLPWHLALVRLSWCFVAVVVVILCLLLVLGQVK